MSMFDVLWMLHQQQQIGAATVTATIAATDAQAQGSSIAELSDRVERLTLVTNALWELLAERAHVSDQDLLAKIHEIDLRVHGASAAGSTRSCPKCGHASSGHRTACLYCGAPIGTSTPFAGL